MLGAIMATKKTVSAAYRESSSRVTVAATGAYGGPTADASSIVLHFYTDWLTIPSVVTYDVDKDGVATEGQVLKQSDLTREVQASVVMSLDLAERVAALLQEKVEGARKDLKKRSKKKRTRKKSSKKS